MLLVKSLVLYVHVITVYLLPCFVLSVWYWVLQVPFSLLFFHFLHFHSLLLSPSLFHPLTLVLFLFLLLFRYLSHFLSLSLSLSCSFSLSFSRSLSPFHSCHYHSFCLSCITRVKLFCCCLLPLLFPFFLLSILCKCMQLATSVIIIA